MIIEMGPGVSQAVLLECLVLELFPTSSPKKILSKIFPQPSLIPSKHCQFPSDVFRGNLSWVDH